MHNHQRSAIGNFRFCQIFYFYSRPNLSETVISIALHWSDWRFENNAILGISNYDANYEATINLQNFCNAQGTRSRGVHGAEWLGLGYMYAGGSSLEHRVSATITCGSEAQWSVSISITRQNIIRTLMCPPAISNSFGPTRIRGQDTWHGWHQASSVTMIKTVCMARLVLLQVVRNQVINLQ